MTVAKMQTGYAPAGCISRFCSRPAGRADAQNAEAPPLLAALGGFEHKAVAALDQTGENARRRQAIRRQRTAKQSHAGITDVGTHVDSRVDSRVDKRVRLWRNAPPSEAAMAVFDPTGP